MAAVVRETSSMAKKKFKRSFKRKREEEVERMDSLPWSTSIPIGEDDDGETFSTLFAGTDELDGGFLSLEEIDAADYNLPLPTTESGETEKGLKSKKKQAQENSDGDKETVDEIIEGEDEDEEEGGVEVEESNGNEDLETPKIKEKKTKKKKKKKEKKKKVKEVEKDKDSSAG